MSKSKIQTRLEKIFIIVIFQSFYFFSTFSQSNNLPVYLEDDMKLLYTPDSLGNCIPDFSYSGFMAGEKSIPNVPIKIVVPCKEGDATSRIQKAIDYVSSLPLMSDGFRGTVLLEPGKFKLTGRLKISASGVILRGSGSHEKGTILVADGKDRETLIKITGIFNKTLEPESIISDEYVPVNARQISVAPPLLFKTGDNIQIRRPSSIQWIKQLNMVEFGGETAWLGWKPGTRDLSWDVEITKIEGNRIIFDSPITTALDKKYGGGYVAKYNWEGRIINIGIENIRLDAAYDDNNLKDEDHCWMAITIENAKDLWIRQIVFQHFAGSAVAIYETSKRVTVEDCISLTPVSEIGGQRRNTFFTMGQQTLFQRCYAEYGCHDFSTGFCTAGPNAFVECISYLPYNFSGTIDSWASGVLFDIVSIDGHALSLKNREADGQGAGWTAANSVLWQCSASRIKCYQPPTAQNWAFGTWGQFSGNGYWYEPNSHVKPRSLYYAQLSDRIGKEAITRAFLLPVSTEASSSPSINQAKEFSVISHQPNLSLMEWIIQAGERQPIPINYTARLVKIIDETNVNLKEPEKQPSTVHIKNGWLVFEEKVLTGDRHGITWWKGNTHPDFISKSNPHITRFVPGRSGTGFTDNIDEVVEWMVQNNIIAIDHNYGLWYDRRRDDHERIRRMDGEVWPPFYELPFARSGKETAWDGLSRYDLTSYNYWYWSRLKEFADKAEKKGKVLIHQDYFQHNILEAGAHWADFPWRTANNINNTGFPEPPPYAGDKRIFMDQQFYDISDPVRRELHKAYIRKGLDNFSENTNVIRLISAEYTGPLHFYEFWIDVISEWEKEKGKKAIIGLSATKDVQDAILIDPIRSKKIDLIDIRYWHYRNDSSVYAPEGGQSLAPRQHARLVNPGKTDFESVYRAVAEYKTKYPDKVVVYSSNGYKNYEWAAFMAGGSMAGIPEIDAQGFYENAASMLPVKQNSNIKALSNNDYESIFYIENTQIVQVDLTKAKGKYEIFYFNSLDGKQLKKSEIIPAGKMVDLPVQKEKIVIWIRKI